MVYTETDIPRVERKKKRSKFFYDLTGTDRQNITSCLRYALFLIFLQNASHIYHGWNAKNAAKFFYDLTETGKTSRPPILYALFSLFENGVHRNIYHGWNAKNAAEIALRPFAFAYFYCTHISVPFYGS